VLCEAWLQPQTEPLNTFKHPIKPVKEPNTRDVHANPGVATHVMMPGFLVRPRLK
jgi:hypothetical protein